MARISEIGTRKKLRVEFDSVPEVFKTIQRLDWKPQKDRASDSRGRQGDFNVFSSLDEAVDTFLNHPEKIRQFSQNDDRLQTYESPGKDVTYDVTGDYLDIDKYLEGVPEVFGNSVMGNPRTIFCTLNVLDCFVSYTSPEYQLAKQKRILRLVDWLENQGVRCQIVSSSDSDVIFSTVVVKEFGDPFNLNHLAVALHPDWLRRIMFLIMEQSKTWQSGYGSAAAYDKRMFGYKPQPEDGVYVYVGGYSPYSGNDTKRLEKDFDDVEQSITDLINSGMTFNEEPLAIGNRSNDWW